MVTFHKPAPFKSSGRRLRPRVRKTAMDVKKKIANVKNRIQKTPELSMIIVCECYNDTNYATYASRLTKMHKKIKRFEYNAQVTLWIASFMKGNLKNHKDKKALTTCRKVSQISISILTLHSRRFCFQTRSKLIM